MTHVDIINLWPSMPVLAFEVESNLGAVKQWKIRNSIPSNKWVKLVEAAQSRDISLTYKTLAEAAAK